MDITLNADSLNPQPDEKVIKGKVVSITFRNDATGFTIFRLEVAKKQPPVTVKGTCGTINVGETATAAGKIETHPKFGESFKARGLVIEAPTNPADIEKYLASGLIKGIGPEMAKRLVSHYGEDTYFTIENHPERLSVIKGIGPKRAEMIRASWEKHRAVHEIMEFLSRRGVGTQRAYAIYRAYKDKPGGAIRVMGDDPYKLTQDVRGIGFRVADDIARTLGFLPDDPRRLRAGVHYVLEEETSKGHCGLPVMQFMNRAAELLGVARSAVELIIEEEMAADRIIRDPIGSTICAFTVRMHQAEGMIAQRLKVLTQGTPPWSIPAIDDAIAEVERAANRTLSDSQREAVKLSLTNKVTIVTGGPGVGKTTTLDTILKVLTRHLDPEFIKLAAPTGRAAKRMTEQTKLPAMTIHRLIGLGGKDESGENYGDDEKKKVDNLENCKLLVVDESSMIDVRLMESLLEKMPKESALLVVGDIDQIPSVGAGSVLRDLIESEMLPVARLTQIFRQAASSRIITNAHAINQGRMPENLPNGQKSDFYLWPVEKPKDPTKSLTETIADEIVDLIANRIPTSQKVDPKTDIQVLAPMRRGDLGTITLNKRLRDALIPKSDSIPSQVWGDWEFRVGDKVMQTSNNYDKKVFNGDLGYVETINHQEKEVRVRFDQLVVPYEFEELDELMPAYAITIHKSQGSEYPVVIIPVVNQHYVMLARNLLYTGVTRGKSLVIVIGQKDAVKRAVQNDEQNRRWTRLRELMENPGFQTYVPRNPQPLKPRPDFVNRQANLPLHQNERAA